MHDTLRIPRRFCGPPDSGNGGYSAGRLAAFVEGPAEVTLRRPPPLERALRVEPGPGGVDLLDGDSLVAHAIPSAVEVDPVAPVDLPAAAAAAAQCPTVVHPDWHPFPTCFVCGPDRAPGDGVRVFPGRVEGRDVFAAPVVFPADLVTDEFPAALVWAALDCPSSYVMYMDGVRPEAPYVLGRITARIDATPSATEPSVAVAWPLGSEGRKLFSASALYTADGEVLAVARATWIAVPVRR